MQIFGPKVKSGREQRFILVFKNTINNEEIRIQNLEARNQKPEARNQNLKPEIIINNQ